MTSRREFLKALAAIGAVAAVPAGAFDALMPAAPLAANAITSAVPGVLALESMQRLYEQISKDRGTPENVFVFSKDLYQRLDFPN